MLVLLLLLTYHDNSPALIMIISGSNLALVLLQSAALGPYFSPEKEKVGKYYVRTAGLAGYPDLKKEVEALKSRR